MNFEKVQRKNRKAISPVLATVILIAITLIAAVAIAGFVFGLFGSFTSSATISASAVNCPKIADAGCEVLLTNTGSSSAAATGCTFSGANGGVGVLSTTAKGAAAQITVAASASNVVAYCQAPAAMVTAATVGAQAVGSVQTSNGASVPFSGTWSA